MSEVTIYTTATCPYCLRAKHLLEKKGAAFAEIRVDLEPQRWQEMETRTQRNTVPQIYIGERHIGGFDDMVELDMDGDLDKLLGVAAS